MCDDDDDEDDVGKNKMGGDDGNLPTSSTTTTTTTTEPESEFNCSVCLCDYSRSQMTFLTCGHFTCTDCMDSHIKSAVDDTQLKSIHLQCPHIDLKDPTIGHTNNNIIKCPYLIPFSITYKTLRKWDILHAAEQKSPTFVEQSQVPIHLWRCGTTLS